ncbi:MAG: geranylgeranyl reductase family protein [Alcanivoracaceae bacterium]|nr:geranylgeranyl reductase family protein [Alcanivoracaceae bacterium]
MTKTRQFDVLVVGAGQAGCAAAQDLAMAGLEVGLLERAPARVTKPCAGGITIKAAQRYRFSLDPVIRQTSHCLEISLGGRRARCLESPAPVALLTHRPELDMFCRQQAQAAGAELIGIRSPGAVHQGREAVTVVAGEHRFSAPWLIAADGANSRIRRLVHGGGQHAGAFAIEGLVAAERIDAMPRMRMDFGCVSDGYGWLFPKADHVNVGLYIAHHRHHVATRQALARYARQALGVDDIQCVQGYPLGTWGNARAMVTGRVLYAGDAAGFTEPLLGEGIYGAVISGQAAARAVIAGSADSYCEAMMAWRHELSRVHGLTRLFYGVLPVSYGALKHVIGAPLVRGVSRGLTLGQTVRYWRRRMAGWPGDGQF